MTEQSSDRSPSQLRTVLKIISGVSTSDGAGVSLTRYIGSAQLDHLDPFLMLVTILPAFLLTPIAGSRP